jgi:hypothetical protein
MTTVLVVAFSIVDFCVCAYVWVSAHDDMMCACVF